MFSQAEEIKTEEANLHIAQEDQAVSLDGEDSFSPRRLSLAEKIKNDPENPHVFWDAFARIQRELQRKSNKLSNGNGVDTATKLNEEILQAATAFKEINALENKQNPLIYSRLVKFASATGLQPDELLEKIKEFFLAVEKGFYSTRNAKPLRKIGEIKAAIPSLSAEELVELDEAIRKQRQLEGIALPSTN